MNAKDRELIRALASEVAEIAALPIQRETIRLWKALNGLRPIRPMVMIDQVPWHEMEVDGELILRCSDAFCRELETGLRRTLYSWKHMKADMVVEAALEVPKTIRGLDFGVPVVQRTVALDPANDVVGHWYEDQLARDEEVAKLHAPSISLDLAATARAEAQARELLDGLLEVRMQGHLPMFALWDRIAEWRGAENALLDLAARPEFTHRLMARLTDAYLSLLDQLEAQGLLPSWQPTIHCTGAWTDELPAPGYDPRAPRAKDLWTAGMAQIFSSVSPAMHREFDIDYAVRWYERFGLGYYGCCDPLDDKIDIIRRLPRVRKISMSPWVDLEKGAERVGKDYVFSRKPSPAFLADRWDPERVERDLRETVAACSRHACPLELILKDVSTVGYKPRRLWEWAEIARKVVGG